VQHYNQELEIQNFEKEDYITQLESINTSLKDSELEQEKNTKELIRLNIEKYELENKKYNFISFVTQRFSDMNKINEVNSLIDNLTKEQLKLSREYYEMSEIKSIIEMEIDIINDLKDSIKQLKDDKPKLKYRYDYLLRDLFWHFSDEPENFKESVSRQVNAKDNIKNLKNKYEKILSYASEQKKQDMYFSNIISTLCNNVWYGRNPTEIALTDGENLIHIEGYTFEYGYEQFMPTVSISLNEKMLYSKNIYNKGMFDDLDKAIQELKKNIIFDNLVVKEHQEEFHKTQISKMGFSESNEKDGIEDEYEME